MRFHQRRGLLRCICKVGNRAKSFFTVIAWARVQQNVTAGHALLHLNDFFTLDVQRFRHMADLVVAQCVAMRGHIGIVLVTLLHRTQVKKQLALRLGRGNFHHAPVFQDVLMHLSLDPVQRIAHQPHALIRIKTLDGLHQANVALLNQVAVWQTVAQIFARRRHHQTQMRKHQLLGRCHVIGLTQLARKGLLLL